MATITLVVPDAGATEVLVGGIKYPVAAGRVTVPRKHLSTMLDNGFELASEVDEVAAWAGADTVGRWDDVLGDITQGNATAALTYEAYRDTNHLMYFFQHNQADALHMRFQMPHAWGLGIVRPHLHFVPMVNPVAPQVFGVKGEWAWADYGQAVPAASGWTAFAATATIAVDDAFKARILALGDVAPTANARGSSILLMRLYRDQGATDTYTTSKSGGTAQANVGLLSFDVHYQKGSQGSVTEIPA